MQASAIRKRGGGDSNPRYTFWAYDGLANRCFKPLSHLSGRAVPRRSAGRMMLTRIIGERIARAKFRSQVDAAAWLIAAVGNKLWI